MDYQLDIRTPELDELAKQISEVGQTIVKLNFQKSQINAEISKALQNYCNLSRLFTEEYEKASADINASTGIDTGTDINQ